VKDFARQLRNKAQVHFEAYEALRALEEGLTEDAGLVGRMVWWMMKTGGK